VRSSRRRRRRKERCNTLKEAKEEVVGRKIKRSSLTSATR